MSPYKPSGLFQVLVVGQGRDNVGATVDELKKRLSNTTVDRKALVKLSASHPVAIKQNVSADIAEQFVKTLKIIGVNCWSEPMPSREQVALMRRKEQR